MAEISTTVEIHLAVRVDDAFRWIVEPGNLVYWMNGVRRAEWLRRQEAEIPRPGDAWEMTYEYSGKENEIIMEVDVCDIRDGCFEFQTIEGNYPINTQYECQRSGDGTLFQMTRTAYSDSTFTAIMFHLTRLISKPMMRKQNQSELIRLKSVIEMQLPSYRGRL